MESSRISPLGPTKRREVNAISPREVIANSGFAADKGNRNVYVEGGFRTWSPWMANRPCYWWWWTELLTADDRRPDENPCNLDKCLVQQLVEQGTLIVSGGFPPPVKSHITFPNNNVTVFGGCLKDHWPSIELQNRGKSHFNMIVWVKNSSPFDTDQRIQIVCANVKCYLRIPGYVNM